MAIERLTQIDEVTREEHYYLTKDDQCFYLGEYTAQKGYSHSVTNQLIKNLKIPTKFRNTNRWYYKSQAVQTAAGALRNNINREWVEGNGVLVPVPPSKTKDHEDYDGRIVSVLTAAFQGYDCDIRELVTQRESTLADHETDLRIGLDELYDLYAIDEKVCDPPPSRIAIVDDVLASGKHFKVTKRILRERFPDAEVIGIFIARVVHDADFSAMFDEK